MYNNTCKRKYKSRIKCKGTFENILSRFKTGYTTGNMAVLFKAGIYFFLSIKNGLLQPV